MRSFLRADNWKSAILKIKMKKKLPGVTIALTAVSLVCFLLLAQAFFMMTSGTMDAVRAERVSTQAVEVAKLDEAALKNVAYNELDSAAHGRRAVEGMGEATGWETEVTVGPEQTLSDGERTKVRMGHISVYAKGDVVSRYELDVPLVSSDFNVKNDDERHRISEKYDDAHKVVDTYVDRQKIYDNVKNDTSNYRISEKYDGKILHDYVNDREVYSRVTNDTPGTKITVKYEGDTVNFYAGDRPAPLPLTVPDYGRAFYLIYALGINFTTIGDCDYRAPKDGYIVITNCNTDIDYWLSINGFMLFHKCQYDWSGSGLFPCKKGDNIHVWAVAQDRTGDGSRRVTIAFIPVRAQNSR